MVHKKIDVRKIFQAGLLAALRDKGIPQHGQGKWLSDTTGHTPKGVGKWLNGDSMPQPEKWADLAVDLGKAPSYFYVLLDGDSDYSRKDFKPRNAAEHLELFSSMLKELPPEEIMKLISELTGIVQESLDKAGTNP